MFDTAHQHTPEPFLIIIAVCFCLLQLAVVFLAAAVGAAALVGTLALIGHAVSFFVAVQPANVAAGLFIPLVIGTVVAALSAVSTL